MSSDSGSQKILKFQDVTVFALLIQTVYLRYGMQVYFATTRRNTCVSRGSPYRREDTNGRSNMKIRENQ